VLLRRLRLTSLLVLCAGIIVAALNMTGAIALELPEGPPAPLQVDGGLHGGAGRMVDGRVITSTVSVLYNAGAEPLVVDGWQALGADGLYVVDVELAANVDGVAYGIFEEYPHKGTTVPGGLHDLPFAVHPADQVFARGSVPQGAGYVLIVSVQLAADRPTGHVDGIRLTYTANGEKGSLDVDFMFTACRADDCDL